jgi:SAM-dependent methyltransferase
MPVTPANARGETSQAAASIAKNQEFFANNDWYKTLQGELELYRFIALSAAHETRNARRLLDVGNGGVFIFPIGHIPEVHAIDIFVEDDFRSRYPTVHWSQMSALDMQFEAPFDTVIAINTLHHIIGNSVGETYGNLDIVMGQVARNLSDGGRFVLLESTVPQWFLRPYKLLFPILLKVWPLRHPPTFQFNFRDILRAADGAGLELRECCWIPKTSDLLTMGFRVRPWMSPIKMGKFVFVKRD